MLNIKDYRKKKYIDSTVPKVHTRGPNVGAT